MASLIIIIISIALVSVAAIMGAYYGGIAFSNNTAQVNANTALNEVHQIFAAATMYGADSGKSNFGIDFDLTNLYNPDTNNNYYLSPPPPIIGMPTGNTGSSAYDQTCTGNLDGETVVASRAICQIDGKNVVNLYLRDSTNVVEDCNHTGTVASADANLPIVKMALAINKTLGVPTGLSYATSGLPYAADGTISFCQIAVGNPAPTYAGFYVNGTEKLNYCYLDALNGTADVITCSFTN